MPLPSLLGSVFSDDSPLPCEHRGSTAPAGPHQPLHFKLQSHRGSLLCEPSTKDSEIADLPQQNPKKKHLLLKEIIYLAVFAGVVVLALYSKVDKEQTLLDWLRKPPQVHFRAMPLSLAFATFILARVLLAPAYRSLIGDYYPPPPWRVIAPVAWLSQMGKYVPGKIFTVAGFAWMMRRFGIPISFGLTAVMLLTGVFVLLGILLSIPLMFQEPLASKVPLALPASIAILLVGLVCLHPKVLGPVANFVLRSAPPPADPPASQDEKLRTAGDQLSRPVAFHRPVDVLHA